MLAFAALKSAKGKNGTITYYFETFTQVANVTSICKGCVISVSNIPLFSFIFQQPSVHGQAAGEAKEEPVGPHVRALHAPDRTPARLRSILGWLLSPQLGLRKKMEKI